MPKRKIKDEIGKYTLEVMQTAGWYNNWLYSLIKPFIEGSILEVGCGIGNITKLLVESGNVTGIDIDLGYIERLKKKFGEKVIAGFGDIEKGKYFFGNKGGIFDTVVCMNVLEHIRKDKKALENMKKLLKKRGRLVLLVPAHQFLYSKFDKKLGHYRRYGKSQIVGLLKAVGLKVKKIKRVNWFSALGWLVFLKIPKKEYLPKSDLRIFDKIGKFLLSVEKIIDPPFGLSIMVVAEKK